MNKGKLKCLSARKLPDTHITNFKHPNPNPTLNLKSLSLSFYNSSTKKCKKQVLYDWQSFIEPSQQQQTEEKDESHVIKNRSASLNKESGAEKKEIRIRKQKSPKKSPLKQTMKVSSLSKSMKSNNFHIKNLVIQNYYNSPYSVPQQKSSAITVLRNKSQIKSVKQKKIDLEKQTIERLKQYLKKM